MGIVEHPRTTARPLGPSAAPRRLHVVNGDSTAASLDPARVPGRVTVWADPLCEGPCPPDLPLERWREVRARYLADAGYAAYDEALATSTGWDRALAEAADYDEVVLWYEHDLFDQVILIRLLDWFAARPPPRLALVSLDRHPSRPRFKGLGELGPVELAGLFEQRAEVTPAQLALGRRAWQAYCAPAPTALAELLAADTAALPFLAGALRRHLEEYPAAGSGLSRSERQVLAALAAGPQPFAALFAAQHDQEQQLFLADSSFARLLRELEPLVELGPPIAITGGGRAVLAGQVDALALRPLDRWLGGVHLRGSGSEVWRWDAANGRLVPPT